MKKELFCYPCDLPFKNRGEHLKFIGKDQWQELELPKIEEIKEIEILSDKVEIDKNYI